MKHLSVVQSLVGEKVSYVWFSDYSICYLELGELQGGRRLPNDRVGSPRGEITVFLGYDWESTFSCVRKSRLNLHAHRGERNSLVSMVQGAVVCTVKVVETDGELEIGLSTGVVLLTISDQGADPDWSIT